MNDIEYVVIPCTYCKQKLRVPLGKNLEVACKNCDGKFSFKTYKCNNCGNNCIYGWGDKESRTVTKCSYCKSVCFFGDLEACIPPKASIKLAYFGLGAVFFGLASIMQETELAGYGLAAGIIGIIALVKFKRDKDNENRAKRLHEEMLRKETDV